MLGNQVPDQFEIAGPLQRAAIDQQGHTDDFEILGQGMAGPDLLSQGLEQVLRRVDPASLHMDYAFDHPQHDGTGNILRAGIFQQFPQDGKTVDDPNSQGAVGVSVIADPAGIARHSCQPGGLGQPPLCRALVCH